MEDKGHMKNITLEELLEAGCHFGHQVIRSNPKARDFVFEARDNIQIIDLAKTKEGLDEAAEYVKNLAASGGSIIIVGTKRQAQAIVAEKVKNLKEQKVEDIYFVNNRWVGGLLTNFTELEKNLKKLKDLREETTDEEKKSKYTKKELNNFAKEIDRLEQFYGGLSGLTKIPEALFIIDSRLEDLAVKEARRMNVQAVAIVDTNADPFVIDYPIPANDDAVGSIDFILSHILEAWKEGKEVAKKAQLKQDQKEKVGDTVKAKEEKTKANTEKKAKKS